MEMDYGGTIPMISAKKRQMVTVAWEAKGRR
jgi:hypothetical protein